MKNTRSAIAALAMLGFSLGLLCSCQETEAEDEYANWEARNSAFVDSIAQVAKANADGRWRTLKSWKKPADNQSALGTTPNPNDYVYLHTVQEAYGTTSPIFSDSVSVSYRGTLINGNVFDETFTSEQLDPATAGRATLYLNSVVVGMTTALQYMSEGEQCTLYIPSALGYDATGKGSIPGYSTLIFDLYLARINPTEP